MPSDHGELGNFVSLDLGRIPLGSWYQAHPFLQVLIVNRTQVVFSDLAEHSLPGASQQLCFSASVCPVMLIAGS